MLLYLAFRNVMSKKSSFVIILFIAFAVMMLVITNSVFDSTEKGVQETFVSSFTGDIVIRPGHKSSLSLFGDETPVTGKLTELPNLIPYDEICSYLSEQRGIAAVVPQVSGMAVLESDSRDTKCYMFGVPAGKYLGMMSSIRIIEGGPWEDGEKGLMLSRQYARRMGARVGDVLQFEISEGFSSRIRAVPLTAVYDYSVENPVLDKIVLTNPETVRAIMDMSDFSGSGDEDVSDEMRRMLDMDFLSIFEDAEDLGEGVLTDEIVLPDGGGEPMDGAYTDSSSWNFLICRAENPKKAGRIIKSLNKSFRERDWPCEAVDWRQAAGSTAFYLYILRLILNIGIIVILGAGFIVVNNTLVINIFDRIREIGTMRAIGANKRYITRECAAETMIMAVIAGAVGCVLGVIGSHLVSGLRITFSNSFIIQLFGGNVLHTSVSLRNLLGAFSLSLFVGLVAFIYPLINAIRVNPVEAMKGAK